MAEKETSMIVKAPVHRVYSEWVYFQEFPKFMDHVKDVKIKSPTKSHWEVELGGTPLHFEAEITKLEENKYLKWRSITGINVGGFIDFEEVPEGTKVTVHFNYMPETLPEKLADMLGAGNVIENQIQDDLNNLKVRAEKMAHAA